MIASISKMILKRSVGNCQHIGNSLHAMIGGCPPIFAFGSGSVSAN